MKDMERILRSGETAKNNDDLVLMGGGEKKVTALEMESGSRCAIFLTQSRQRFMVGWGVGRENEKFHRALDMW